jgi:hypothetical protein
MGGFEVLGATERGVVQRIRWHLDAVTQPVAGQEPPLYFQRRAWIAVEYVKA